MLVAVFIVLLVFLVILGWKKPAIAFVAAFAVSFGLFLSVIDAWRYMPEYIVFAPLILIATFIAILISNGPNTPRWPRRCVKAILLALAALILAPIALGVTPGGFLPLLIAVFVVSYIIKSRHAIAGYVFSTIGSSIRQNLPLAMALESAAGGLNDKRSRILRNIKDWLVQGYPLSESIKLGYPQCPGHIIATITAAEKIDQLPSAIKSIENDLVASANEKRRVKTFYPLYIGIVLLWMFLVVLVLTTFVFPQFMAVLNEVREMTQGVALPRATQILLQITNWIAYGYGWVFGVAAILVLYIIFPVAVRVRFRPRRPDKPYIISRIGDFVKWHLPVLRWFENNNSTLQVIEMLRLSLDSGCPVNQAIENTIGLDVNNCFRKRVRKWLSMVEAGNNVSDSARKSGVGHAIAWAFDDKVNAGNTLNILETLESVYRSNYSYRANLVRIVFGPCATVMLGVMVGFIAYAVFTPIVVILTNLTGGYVP